ncbi:MAG TPA: glycosyltransferase family 4 protein [Polyangiaceae bacterium]
MSSFPPASRSLNKIAFVGNHLPRRCGIATFTTDLCAAVAASGPPRECLVVAMNDTGHSHVYPHHVRFEIDEGEIGGYRRAAQFLNANQVDVVSLQHEYGIFGGVAGGHVLTLLRELRVPVVTTLHTILTAPSAQQRSVLDEIIALSERIVVMSSHGQDTVRDLHGVPDGSVDVIPHGISRATGASPSRERLGFANRQVVLTFGLLSPDKGLEYMIEALPAILARHRDVVFVVLGATHPHVKQRNGETYRLQLTTLARRLGVADNVHFEDRFVTDGELAAFLALADVYVTPYLNPEQSTSGTLARAVAAGKAIVSTPYWHARELLGEGRGVLVPPRDAAALAEAVGDLLGDTARRAALGERAAAAGRKTSWPIVAELYLESFEKARHEEKRSRRSTLTGVIPASDLPELNLDHLLRMTDDTGLLQHARFAIPRYAEGYALDDNARALLLVARDDEFGAANAKTVRELTMRYLAFVCYAFDAGRSRFRNFMSYARQWSEEQGSEDSHGHAVWALGATIGRAGDPGLGSLSGELFHAALPQMLTFTSPRAWAYGLLGIEEYLRAFDGDTGVQTVRQGLLELLVDRHRKSSTPDWPWFESSLTYANARLAQAVIVSGSATGSQELLRLGLDALQWLAQLQISEHDEFAPIGSNGFYERGGQKAEFDQQPIEAAGMVSASLEALRASRQPIWAEHACRAFDWFLGKNHLRRPLYDASTGGCRDALHADRPNENQGAESTLSFLLALVEMRSLDYTRQPRAKGARK